MFLIKLNFMRRKYNVPNGYLTPVNRNDPVRRLNASREPYF